MNGIFLALCFKNFRIYFGYFAFVLSVCVLSVYSVFIVFRFQEFARPTGIFMILNGFPGLKP